MRWLAPEVLEGRMQHNSASRRAADIYAFACAGYEIFSGKTPFFELSTDAAVVLAVVNRGIRPTRPPPFICMRRKLDEDLWRLLRDCWSTLPLARPSAGEVVARLKS